MRAARKQHRQTTINLAVDSAIFIAFLVAMAPRFSGIAIHEWLSIAFGAAIVTHLLLHWQWLVGVTRRFFGKVRWSARINYLLNALLFIDMTIAIFSGVMISEAALPLFGVTLTPNFFWRSLHELSANLSLALVGLHVALHWQWLVSALMRVIRAPFATRRREPQVAATSTQREV